MKKLFFLAALLFVAALSYSQPTSKAMLMRVWRVSDGDNVSVVDSSRKVGFNIRLLCIDAPEVNNLYSREQPYGQLATLQTRALLLGATVLVDTFGRDQFKRMLGRVYFGEGVTDFGLYSVSQGWSWSYAHPGAGEYLKSLEALNKTAKKEKRGLFGLKGRKTRPETWRKNKMGSPREVLPPGV